MTDKKISALTAATIPLAGTEVLPIVQSNTTVKISTNDLTVRNIRAAATTGILQVSGLSAASTRTMTIPDANFTAARTDAAQSFTGDQILNNGNLIFGTAGKGILGTTTNNNADVGNVGQYVESVASTAVNCGASTAWSDVTSISLTAGDWDISASLYIFNNGATWTRADLGVNAIAGDNGTGIFTGVNQFLMIFASTSTAITSLTFAMPPYRVSLASTTTYYLKANATYSAGTPKTGFGRISARRVR